MKILSICLCLLLPIAASAFDPDDFARVWTLQPETDAAAYRLQLDPEVHRTVTGNDLSDLLITDTDNQPVPFVALPRDKLIEPLATRLPLTFESAAAEETSADNETAGGPLELELEHGETRLVLTTPPREPPAENDKLLIHEALIASPEVAPELPDRTLVLRFTSESRADLECRYRDADHSDWREQSLQFGDEGTTHPYRYTATADVDLPPRAWHVRCFGHSVPSGFELHEAYLNARGQHLHADSHRLEPELSPVDGAYQFNLPGPYRVLGVEVNAAESNQLADITIESRADEDQRWRWRGENVLSTLPGTEAGPAYFDLEPGPRHRRWRIKAQPTLPSPPRVTVEIDVEELVFLAQGEGPWKLYAGSHSSPETSAPGDLIEKIHEQLGQAWTWPVVTASQPREAGGTEALVAPSEPIPWRRLFLWGVLIIGALLLIWQSLRLLRKD